MSTVTLIKPNIRKAQPSDAEHLFAFFSSSLEENFSYFPQEAKSSYLQSLSLDSLQKKLSTNHEIILIAESQEKICGFLFGGKPEGGVGTIIWLIIGSQFQGLGIGKELLKNAFYAYHLLNSHKIKLTVHDERAVKFYLREGFEIEGRHPCHWWNINFYSLAYSLNNDRNFSELIL